MITERVVSDLSKEIERLRQERINAGKGHLLTITDGRDNLAMVIAVDSVGNVEILVLESSSLTSHSLVQYEDD